MDEPIRPGTERADRPPENRTVILVSGRVVEVETIHVGKSVWVAAGRVSEPLPSGPFLRSPLEVTATGRSEQSAMDALRRRVELLAARQPG